MSMFWDAFKAGDFDYLLQWMKYNWTLSLYISLVYVILIFWGQVCTTSFVSLLTKTYFCVITLVEDGFYRIPSFWALDNFVVATTSAFFHRWVMGSN